MEKNNIDFRERTAQGYEVIVLIKQPFNTYRNEPLYDAIVKRETDYLPYVVCCGYTCSDGTWGNGIYCDSYNNAVGELKRIL